MELKQDINIISFDKFLTISTILSRGRMYNGNFFVISVDKESGNELFRYPTRIDAYIVLICSKGKMEFSCNLKHFVVSSGMSFVYRPGMIIELLDFEPSSLTLLIFKQEFLNRLNIKVKNAASLYMLTRDAFCLPLSTADCQYLCQLFSFVYDSIKGNEHNSYYHKMMDSLISSGFYRFLYLTEENFANETLPDLPQRRDEYYFRQFMDLLSKYYTTNRSVKFYASKIHLNPKYLSNLIRKVSGKSAVRWIDEYVILEAKNLIKYSDMSIQEISYALNFPNQSFFGKYFKKHAGISPKRYRDKE